MAMGIRTSMALDFRAIKASIRDLETRFNRLAHLTDSERERRIILEAMNRLRDELKRRQSDNSHRTHRSPP